MQDDTCMSAPVTTQLSEPRHKLHKHGSEVTAREIPRYVCVYYSHYMCTHALLMLHVYTCTTHTTCVHMPGFHTGFLSGRGRFFSRMANLS